MTRTLLGSWRCPSGNSVDAFIRDGAAETAFRYLELEWDAPPPLSADDEIYYGGVILPKLARRVQEYLEKPGRALVVRV